MAKRAKKTGTIAAVVRAGAKKVKVPPARRAEYQARAKQAWKTRRAKV